MQLVQAIVAYLPLQRLVEPRPAVVDAQFGERRGVAAQQLQVELIEAAADALRSTAWPASGSGRLSRRYWTSLFASICAANSRRTCSAPTPWLPACPASICNCCSSRGLSCTALPDWALLWAT